MLAIENRGVGVGIGAKVGDQPGGFVVLIAEALHGHFMRRFRVGGELFLKQPRILRQHAAGGFEDLSGAAAVLVEDDRLDVVIAAEALEHVGVGAGPGEDRLLVVADGEEVRMRRGQAFQQIVLHGVHVLEFVHEQVIPALGNSIGEFLGFDDQVVEIHHVAVREPGLVLAINSRLVWC